jgi:hypothetical protein
MGDGLILKEDLPAGRGVNSGQKIEKGGLPRAIGADDAENFPLVDMEFDVVDGGQSTEELAKVTDLKERGHKGFRV